MYIRELRDANAVDFSGMLYLPWRILCKSPKLAEKMSKRFQFVLVDEAQDTNEIQYETAKKLAAHGNLFMVGDFQQSIFSWRGAKPENLNQFNRDFPNAVNIVLPRNYRSHSEILERAESVIHRNPDTDHVALIAERGMGGGVHYHQYEDERDEASSVIQKIREYHDAGYKWEDIAVIYRLNKLSQVFEMDLSQDGIPYRTRGGRSFFDCKEIKTALAYLKLLVNPGDSSAFARAIGSPKRGVGDTLIGQIDNLAKEKNITVTEAAARVKARTGTARAQLDEFGTLMDEMRVLLNSGGSLMTVAENLINRSGYKAQLNEEAADEVDGPRSYLRVENMDGFLTSIGEFEDASKKPSLEHFLQRIALTQDGDKDKQTDAVSLMTMHSAKGLEFSIVFIVGAYDGVIPHFLAEEEGRMEEERRLFYVAVTRAKDHLHISYPEEVRRYNRRNFTYRSPFLVEMLDSEV
jgi:DNA helicase-2/ATP-dependent DNA helicase PcrA